MRKVLALYEKQNEEEAVDEDEAAYEKRTQTAMEIPIQLVPDVREKGSMEIMFCSLRAIIF